MKFEISTTTRFEKDVQLAKKRGFKIEKLLNVVEMLADDVKLPQKNKDHFLSGDYSCCRECHIEPDWLLIYKKEDTIKLLTLIRTGTHSDLF